MFVFWEQHVEELRTNYHGNPGQGLADEIVEYEGRVKLNLHKNFRRKKESNKIVWLPPTRKPHRSLTEIMSVETSHSISLWLQVTSRAQRHL